MSDSEKTGVDRKDGGRKKDGKKEKKEKGYMMFDAEASDEELVNQEDLKSPSKMKKTKAFRFGPKKDIFPKVKDDKKEKDGKKEEKEKRKGEKEGKKRKLKVKMKSKHQHLEKVVVPETIEKPVFGVQLTVALERNRSHDGIQLPAIFRECVDYIEEHGLHCEGIYRISGVKSKVQHLKDQYNRGEPAFLEEHEPNIVAGVLKQFLRELPEPVLTNALIPKFEEASTIRNERKRSEAFYKLIHSLPECNRLLLSWMVVHMTHVIERQKENKMTLQNVSIVLSPTMQISHRVLNVLFMHSKQLFKETIIKRYVPPLKPATSKWSLMLPDNPQALQEELSKQESLLSHLHEALAAGEADREKEEQIWEVQRVCTQLKRKIKLAQKNQETMEKRRKERDDQSKRNTVLEEGEEELNLELKQLPGEEVLHLELRKPSHEVDQTNESHQQQVTVQIETREVTSTESITDDTAEKKNEAENNKLTLKELANQNKEKKELTNQNEDKKELANQNEDKKELANQNEDKEELTTHNEDGKDEESLANQKDDERECVDEVTKVELAVEGNVEDAGADRIDDLEEIRVKSEAEQEEADTDKKEKEDAMEMTKPEEEAIRSEEEGTEERNEEVDVDNDENETADVIEDVGTLTADDVRQSLEKKREMLLQEDTTDSELGKSQEDIQASRSISEDEFEHSLEEILEKELHGDVESDKEISNAESKEALTSDHDQETEDNVVTDTKTPIPLDTKTPVPMETVESPPTTTPIPHPTDEDKDIQSNTSLETDDAEESEVEIVSVPEVLQSELSETTEMSEISEEESFDEEEYNLLLDEEQCLRLEEEELLAIEDELRKKIETEKCESDRLRQEIDEIQYLRQDSDEEFLSTSSDSSYESDDEEDLQEILNKLILENEELEKQNSDFCAKIHDERMQCLEVKIQIRLIQKKTLQTSTGNESLLDKDFLIEFD